MILFVSKTDSESGMLHAEINQDVDLRTLIQFVFVDSKVIHDIISTSKNVIIERIPCLLSITDQSISKYEGTNKILELLTEIKDDIQRQKTPAYTSLSDINLDAEAAPAEEEESVSLSTPIMQQQQPSGVVRDNASPEKIKITSPPFIPPTVKKK